MRAIVGILFIGFGSSAAFAIAIKGSTSVGLMQQPTSHYYLFSYGGQADVSTDGDGFIARIQYVERPEFRTTGFRDKDYGTFGLVGTKLGKISTHGFYAFFGVGQMAGYTKAVADAPGIIQDATRNYSLNGPTASLEYLARLGPVDFSVGHQTFIGFVDKGEMQAYVAWPYNFFSTSVGFRW